MGNWTALKAAVAAIVKTNGNNEITGQMLQDTLFGVIDNLGLNSQYKGIAIPSTNPGTPDNKVYYFANEIGTYANFGGIVISNNGLNILAYDGTTWGKINIYGNAAPIITPKPDMETAIDLQYNYPNAVFGWAARVKADGYIYSFDGNLPWKNTYLTDFPVPMATKEDAEKNKYITTACEFILGGISISDTDYLIEKGAGYGTTIFKDFLTLKGIYKINFNSKTYNSGQPNIFFFKQNNYDSFSFVQSYYYPAGKVMLATDFPDTSTHYLVLGITDLSSDIFCDEYRLTSTAIKNVEDSLILEEKKESNFVSEQTYLMAIVDITKTKQYRLLNQVTGKADASQWDYNYSTDFCKIEKGVLYDCEYLNYVLQFDRKYNYLGLATLTNVQSQFIIENENCEYIRAQCPNKDSQIVIKKFIINAPFGTLRPSYKGYRESDKSKLYKFPIQGFGDSLIARGNWVQVCSNLTGREVTAYSYGGMVSSFIRDRFIQFGNMDNAINLIWVGQNSYLDVDNAVSDIKKMVKKLTHQRFIIVTPLTCWMGDEAGTILARTVIEELENKVEAIFSNNSLLMRKAIVNGAYDMGNVKLTSPFTQPVVGTTVTIHVSDVLFFNHINTDDEIYSSIASQHVLMIGYRRVYDKYDIISTSIDSGGDGLQGTITARLKANSSYYTPIGSIVNNIITTSTPTGSGTSYEFTRYIEVIKEADFYMMSLGCIPPSMRDDGIHPGGYNADCIGELVAYKVSSLGF